MDPLSITCGVLAGLHAVRKTCEIFDTLRNMPKEIEDLRTEFMYLSEVLTNLKRMLNDEQNNSLDRESVDLLCSILQHAGSQVDQVDVRLRMYGLTSEKRVVPIANVRRVLWLREKPLLIRHRQAIHETRLHILCVCGSINVSSSSRLERKLDMLTSSVQTTSQYVEDIRTTGLAGNERPRTSGVSVATNESPLPGPDLTSPTLEALPAPGCRSLTINQYQNQVRIEHVGPDFSMTYCRCHCHRNQDYRLFEAFETMIGKLHFTWSSESTCNQPTCRVQCQSGLSKRSVSWTTPAWTRFRRGLILTLENAFFSGPKLTLSFPRLVSGNALIFHYAVIGDAEGVKRLLASGAASPNDVKYDSGFTPFHYAVEANSVAVCRLLLAARGNATLHTCASNTAASNAVTKILCQTAGADTTAQLRTMFNVTEITSSWQLTRFHEIVIGLSQESIEQALVDDVRGLDAPDERGRTPLSWAAQKGEERTVRLLLEHLADPDSVDLMGMTPLHYAMHAQNPLILKHLLAFSTKSVNAQDRDRGRTPLHQAAFMQKDPIYIKMLLEVDAVVDMRSTNGKSALLLAVLACHDKGVELLLDSGADAELLCWDGYTALTLAIMTRDPRCLTVLLRHGVSLVRRYWGGDTVLHLLARHATEEVIRCLLTVNLADIDFDAKNDAGKTAQAVLTERDHIGQQTLLAFSKMVQKIQLDQAERHAREVASVVAEELLAEIWHDTIEYSLPRVPHDKQDLAAMAIHPADLSHAAVEQTSVCG